MVDLEPPGVLGCGTYLSSHGLFQRGKRKTGSFPTPQKLSHTDFGRSFRLLAVSFSGSLVFFWSQLVISFKRKPKKHMDSDVWLKKLIFLIFVHQSFSET